MKPKRGGRDPDILAPRRGQQPEVLIRRQLPAEEEIESAGDAAISQMSQAGGDHPVGNTECTPTDQNPRVDKGIRS